MNLTWLFAVVIIPCILLYLGKFLDKNKESMIPSTGQVKTFFLNNFFLIIGLVYSLAGIIAWQMGFKNVDFTKLISIYQFIITVTLYLFLFVQIEISFLIFSSIRTRNDIVKYLSATISSTYESALKADLKTNERINENSQFTLNELNKINAVLWERIHDLENRLSVIEKSK